MLQARSFDAAKKTSRGTAVARPTRRQVEVSRAAVAWYLRTHYGRSGDSGTLSMFCDSAKMGAFAVSREGIAAGDAAELFRLLVTVAMFQRRQDLQILRILRSLSDADAAEISSMSMLLRFVDEGRCPHMRSVESVTEDCDLAKDDLKRGCCQKNPSFGCHMKRHTVLLRRYGHFGKVPTSIALMVREAGGGDLNGLRKRVLAEVKDPLARAVALETALSRAWRISQKIASMFLSCVTNPALSPGAAPWSEGVDWTYFVVVDSNVDLFLGSIGYRGAGTYASRRAFVRALAERIDLRELSPTLDSYNPRLVQQAMYLFMSASNRRAAQDDCGNLAAPPCAECPRALSTRCPRRA
jgi:hypothetical protein